MLDGRSETSFDADGSASRESLHLKMKELEEGKKQLGRQVDKERRKLEYDDDEVFVKREKRRLEEEKDKEH